MSANEVDRALASHVAEVGTKLLALREDQWFDRKSIKTNPKDLASPMIALANAEGGVLVIGLHNGRIEGIKRHASKLNDIKQVAVDFTVPPVRARVDQVGCVNDDGEPDSLIIIRVDPGERVHELTNGDCFLRIGDESRKLRHEQRQELEFDRGQSQYDGLPLSGIAVIDLDPDLVKHFRDATGATGTTTNLLKARSLATRTGEMTNGCYLLFAPQPQDTFPQAYIRVIKYLSAERGTGERLSIEEGNDIRIEGPIPRAIAEAARVIESLVPQRRALRATGLFESEPIVPRDAWLEGLVNAVIHRSYSLGGDHIRVEIYPDRVELESPGRFPGLADPARPLDISRYARNPRIARVCADLRIGQELGEGIKRIFEEMRRVGLTDPVYTQGQGSVRLKLLAIRRIDPQTAARLPANSEQIVDLLRATESGLSTGDISEAIGMSRPAAKVRLRALEKENLIRWQGKSPNDPRAVWSITLN
jgi:ATP-dependent DNA helicase RecG